ncbi:unnamed protein product, partial [Mesorhabditis belari]|uniref:Uncharacterized protein n=1 Tax=Mesorhabditis belari TaxID=2138241 RepID=A0AAF3FBP8_9BILA
MLKPFIFLAFLGLSIAITCKQKLTGEKEAQDVDCGDCGFCRAIALEAPQSGDSPASHVKTKGCGCGEKTITKLEKDERVNKLNDCFEASETNADFSDSGKPVGFLKDLCCVEPDSKPAEKQKEKPAEKRVEKTPEQSAEKTKTPEKTPEKTAEKEKPKTA